jgi:hypothetical protein
MPIVFFMPYYPDIEVDRATANFHLWNWWRHREKRVPDQSIRSHLDKYFALYRRTDGGVEQRIAIISPGDVDTFREKTEFSGREISRFANVVMASHLFELPVEKNDGRAICTSDNFAVLCQEFNPRATDPHLSFSFGSYVRPIVAGSWDRLLFTTPLSITDLGPCQPELTILSHLATLCREMGGTVNRLFRSLEWLRLGFANYEGLEPSARIIAMATAFEVLLGFPEQDKTRHFAGTVNRYIPPNRLPTTTLLWGQGRVSGVTENTVGWWCREFYNFRNRIVRGEEISETDFRNARGEEHLRIALSLFEECIWGLLIELGKLPEEDRARRFFSRSRWRAQLGLPDDVWYP